jgi:hypothetical protein
MSASTIQWAAFYSDCEHEIKAISKGTRLTLIYDLYIREEKGDIASPNAIVDYRTLPIYGYVKSLVEEPGFMKDGKLDIPTLYLTTDSLKVGFSASSAPTSMSTLRTVNWISFQGTLKVLISFYTPFSSHLVSK